MQTTIAVLLILALSGCAGNRTNIYHQEPIATIGLQHANALCNNGAQRTQVGDARLGGMILIAVIDRLVNANRKRQCMKALGYIEIEGQ